MLVLGIESSCDETAAAVVTGDGEIRSDLVLSQVAAHAPYGGVVPEIAARDHVRAIGPLVEQALAQAELQLADVDGIAVTCRPGLVGSLLVGIQTAKGLAWAAGKPLVGVDHLLGHLLAVFLRRPSDPPGAERPSFPFIGLLISGGHTALYRCEGPRKEQIEELGATRDDAVGEAYDKVAKLLGLGYPGGPIIDRLAARGRAARASVELTPPLAHSLEFSFSGIKSAMARHVAREGAPPDEQAVADLCAAFQAVVIRTMASKALRAAREQGVDSIVMAGGVAANRGLRALLAAGAAKRGQRLFVPPPLSCTDNAAMIAYAGALRLTAGERDGLDLGPATTTELPQITRKGRGKRQRRQRA